MNRINNFDTECANYSFHGTDHSMPVTEINGANLFERLGVCIYTHTHMHNLQFLTHDFSFNFGLGLMNHIKKIFKTIKEIIFHLEHPEPGEKLSN